VQRLVQPHTFPARVSLEQAASRFPASKLPLITPGPAGRENPHHACNVLKLARASSSYSCRTHARAALTSMPASSTERLLRCIAAKMLGVLRRQRQALPGSKEAVPILRSAESTSTHLYCCKLQHTRFRSCEDCSRRRRAGGKRGPTAA
jgi:hypothetical protein